MITMSVLLIIWALMVGVVLFYRKRGTDCINNPAIRCWNDWLCWNTGGSTQQNTDIPYTGTNVRKPTNFDNFYDANGRMSTAVSGGTNWSSIGCTLTNGQIGIQNFVASTTSCPTGTTQVATGSCPGADSGAVCCQPNGLSYCK